MISSVWNQDPKYWDTRTDLPSVDDFDVITEWQKAMDDWQKANQGTPMYAGDTSTPYTRDDGSVGQWMTAGMSENNPSYGLSEAVINANELNRKFMEMVQNPNGPGPGLGLALANMIKQRPDMIQSAYQAVDKNGESVLAPEVVAYLERLGVRPSADITQPRPPADEGNWSKARLGHFNTRFMDYIDENLAEGGLAYVNDGSFQKYIDRLMAGTGSSYEEALAHIDKTLNDFGFDIGFGGAIVPLEPDDLEGQPMPGGTENPLPQEPGQGGTQQAAPQTQEMGAMSTTYDGGPETQIVPGANNAKQIQALAKQYPNSGTGDLPEWMQLAIANRGGTRRPMNPRGMLGF